MAFPWEQLIIAIFMKTLLVFEEPMFWIILALVGYQYYQQRQNQQRLFGTKVHSLRHQIVLAAFLGALGGMVASFLLLLFGVTLNQLGFNYIWPVALVLMAIQTRFLCFAYAGGLVALSNVLFGWPNVNVPHLLALVAILHVTESLLIALSGRSSALPLILRRGNGQLVGAFSLQSFWPLPLVVLVAFLGEAGSVQRSIFTHLDWWPLIEQNLAPVEGRNWLYLTLPVVAALGYSDMAISSFPAQRRRSSAFHLFLYSITLLALAVLSAKYHWLQAIAAVASPLGHEYLIQRDNAAESQGRPLFVPPDRGVMVLESVIDSPARKLGLRTGDILRRLDGLEIRSTYDLAQGIALAGSAPLLEWERQGAQQQGRIRWGEERRLGIIPVPEGHEGHWVELEEARIPLRDWWRAKFGKK